MKTIELFSGTGSFSKVSGSLGHSTKTVDIDITNNPDHARDVLSMLPIEVTGYDIIWASPPCTAFSVASIGTHWTGGKGAYIPKDDVAVNGLKLLDHTIMMISESGCLYWFIENPRGVMRKVIDEMFVRHGMTKYRRVSVTYCQYGDTRMKPTDIWTNLEGWEGRFCRNGAPCHERAPRGSKTGTQGLKGAKERGVIPSQLFIDIFKHIKNITI